MEKTLLSWAVITSLALFSMPVTAATGKEQPVCLAGDAPGSCREEAEQCTLWMAPSSMVQNTLGLYAGVHVSPLERIGEQGSGDILLSMMDSNMREWAPWHELSWNVGDLLPNLKLDNHFEHRILLPGLGSLVQCSGPLRNVQQGNDYQVDNVGVHRSKDASAGSFAYRHDVPFIATQDIYAGQELFSHCGGHGGVVGQQAGVEHTMRPIEWLEEHGHCVDNLLVKPSSLPGIGRGAFAKRAVPKGEVIVTSPVMQIDRFQTEIVKQSLETEGNERTMKYTEHVEGHNLLLNYAFHHPSSSVLLLPYGPGVNYINHHSDQPKVNAVLEWADDESMNYDVFAKSASDLLHEDEDELLVHFVALRDIEPGEEIFIDYGEAFETAWEMHQTSWEPSSDDDYISASDFRKKHDNEPVRTTEEQDESPYPANIQTACYYNEDASLATIDNDEGATISWDQTNVVACLRPCQIHSRRNVEGNDVYDVEVFEMTSHLFSCHLNAKSRKVTNVPAIAVILVDREYSTDEHLRSAFRHPIGVPNEFYPEEWTSMDAKPEGDFEPKKMKTGQIEQVRWAENGEVVTPNAHVIGLNPRIRESLLEYCEESGITEAFRELTYRGNQLAVNDDDTVELGGHEWFVQRPEGHWKSNMHWISPMGAGAHQDYLEALGAAGFDEALQDIGEHFGLNGLACYHVTFIAVSHCTQGYLHYDLSDTGAAAFNVIIPLILANETGPELDIQNSAATEEEDWEVGRYRYQYDVAAMVGDDAYHATSAMDYSGTKEMRMAATVYVADLSTDNIDAILRDYTQNYPPKDDPNLLLAMAGTHWKKGDPSIRLPRP